ncbi:MAG: hypothetical protein FJ130_12360 [Deltaproteobacteria bacterium]|nr:hypothetical protein [Deltaproteobacteria bacterium]
MPKKALDKVHAPIGLAIHPEPSEMIAVSIVAELNYGKKKGFGINIAYY